MKRRTLFTTIALFFSFYGFLTISAVSVNNYPITPIPFTSVKINDSFWAPRIQTNYKVTIPIAIDQCYSTGRVDNFLYAGGIKEGQFCTQYPFDDTDIYKLIEAASYSLQNIPDKKLEAQLDTLIFYVGEAQEDDGYLFTNRTINPDSTHAWVGYERWINSPINMSHELYNSGHLFEAAVAHFQATKKRSLLNIAIKNADLLVTDFLKKELNIYPGHQIVEMGLVRLYGVTDKKEYLDLAKYFLDVRGPGGQEYNQAHKKVINQTEPVGHAVRATYMYSGMADIGAIFKDSTYIKATQAIWNNLVSKKMYITGGIGSGGGNEGFDPEYELPNMSAYCETCASIGNVFWNQRMFLNEGDGKYIDVLERSLYNSLLSGVSLSGDRFFYPNVLESSGQHERSKWFGCACCPPNIARLLPSLPGYIYAKTKNSIFVNIYTNNTAKFDFNNKEIEIQQQTNYPWDGKVSLHVNPKKSISFNLKLRIPGWAKNEVLPGNLYTYANKKNVSIKVLLNGNKIESDIKNGYLTLNKKWKKGDKIELILPMPIRVLLADERVKADNNKMAIQRGPIVYCAEWPYTNNGKVLSLVFDKNSEFKTEYDSTLLNGVVKITTEATPMKRLLNNYIESGSPSKVTLIPYYAWNNQGAGEMEVWLPYNKKSVKPLPAPTIAYNSKIIADINSKAITALNDQYEPSNSNDHTMPYLHWWPQKDKWVWVQYDFEKPEKVSSCKIYWFDDEPFGGCRIPDNYELYYKEANKWHPVKETAKDSISKDKWNIISFEPMVTNALKLKIKINKNFSTGIHEWIVK